MINEKRETYIENVINRSNDSKLLSKIENL